MSPSRVCACVCVFTSLTTQAVMADAIQRWFVDTLRNAKNGDINQAALLAEMLATGYGCNKDLDEAGGRLLYIIHPRARRCRSRRL